MYYITETGVREYGVYYFKPSGHLHIITQGINMSAAIQLVNYLHGGTATKEFAEWLSIHF